MIAKLFELRDKKLKENKKKGFTLVELIVVLVILAILAALLIPTLTGYINKAKEKSIIAETRQVVMAAQTIADEQYGTLTLTGSGTVTYSLNTTAKAKSSATTKADGSSVIDLSRDEIAELAEVTTDNIKSISGSNGKITGVEYAEDGMTCTYDASSGKGTYSVAKTTN